MIQEFNVIENPPAQYGWKPGAIVNVGLNRAPTTFTGQPMPSGAATPLTPATTSILLPQTELARSSVHRRFLYVTKIPYNSNSSERPLVGQSRKTSCSFSWDLKTSVIRWVICLSATSLKICLKRPLIQRKVCRTPFWT